MLEPPCDQTTAFSLNPDGSPAVCSSNLNFKSSSSAVGGSGALGFGVAADPVHGYEKTWGQKWRRSWWGALGLDVAYEQWQANENRIIVLNRAIDDSNQALADFNSIDAALTAEVAAGGGTGAEVVVTEHLVIPWLSSGIMSKYDSARTLPANKLENKVYTKDTAHSEITNLEENIVWLEKQKAEAKKAIDAVKTGLIAAYKRMPGMTVTDAEATKLADAKMDEQRVEWLKKENDLGMALSVILPKEAPQPTSAGGIDRIVGKGTYDMQKGERFDKRLALATSTYAAQVEADKVAAQQKVDAIINATKSAKGGARRNRKRSQRNKSRRNKSRRNGHSKTRFTRRT